MPLVEHSQRCPLGRHFNSNYLEPTERSNRRAREILKANSRMRPLSATEVMVMAMMYWSPRRRILIQYKSKQEAHEALAVMRAYVKASKEPLLTGET